MRLSAAGTGRIVVTVAALAGLLTACGGGASSTTSASSAAPSSAGQETTAPQLPTGALSAACQVYAKAVQTSLTAGAGGVDRMQLAAVQATDAASKITDPKLRTAAQGLAQYDKQAVAHKQNPTNAKPADSNLLNSATEALGGCVKH